MTDSDRLAWKVRAWWNERLNEGCQLQHIEDAKPRFDYAGQGPWFRRVALHALWLDFCRSTGESPIYHIFAMAFNRATGIRDRVHKYVPCKTPNGNNGKKLVLFIRFDDQPGGPLPI